MLHQIGRLNSILAPIYPNILVVAANLKLFVFALHLSSFLLLDMIILIQGYLGLQTEFSIYQ